MCVRVSSSCLLVPEATVLIAQIDELCSPSSLPLWLHMKAGLILIKASRLFVVKVVATETCAAGAGSTAARTFIPFFLPLLKFHSLKFIHHPLKTELVAAWSNIN